MRKAILVFGILLGLIGCSADYKAEVYSNVQWEGRIGNQVIPPTWSGYTKFDIPDDSVVCVEVWTVNGDGYVTLHLFADGSLLESVDHSYVKSDSTGYAINCTLNRQ